MLGAVDASQSAVICEASVLPRQEIVAQLGIAQSSYAIWESHIPALRPDQIIRLAEILAVTTADLFGTDTPTTLKQGGPLGRARRVFDEVSALPRKKQKRILDVVEDLLTVHGSDSG